MACGKPVVCTRHSSLPELIEDGQGGYLCALDSLEEFAEAVRRLAADPERRRQMGAHNRAKAEREFSLGRCAREYTKLYGELL